MLKSQELEPTIQIFVRAQSTNDAIVMQRKNFLTNFLLTC